MKMIPYSLLVLLLFTIPAVAQERPVINLVNELIRCSTLETEDGDATLIQVVSLDEKKKTLHITRVTKWYDGGAWSEDYYVPLGEIDINSIISLSPNTGVQETLNPMIQNGGVEMLTSRAVITVKENRDGVADTAMTSRAFIRVDEDDKRDCVLLALLAIVSEVQGIRNPESDQ